MKVEHYNQISRQSSRTKPERTRRRNTRRGSPWTLAEIRVLGKVRDSVLARRTGRTIAEIVAERQARRISLPEARSWTAREIRLLGTVSDQELARRLRRFAGDVRHQRAIHGIAPFKPRGKVLRFAKVRPWSLEEDSLLGTMRDDHLARRLRRNAKSVSYRRNKLGIQRAFTPPWTREQDALLGKKPDQELARLFHRTPEAVAARRLKLGISLSSGARLRRYPHRWKARELRWLGRFSDADAARRIGCTEIVARKKRQELQVPLRRDVSKRKLWTVKEDSLVGTMSEMELSRRLGRSLASIIHRRFKLGRPAFHPGLKRWTDAELVLLGKLPDEEVAKRTGHPVSSVAQKRADLRLPPAQPRRRPWQAQEIALLGTDTDKAIGARLRRDKTTVAGKRLELGIAPFHIWKSCKNW